jgi:hypothetical protein
LGVTSVSEKGVGLGRLSATVWELLDGEGRKKKRLLVSAVAPASGEDAVTAAIRTRHVRGFDRPLVIGGAGC